MSETNTPPKWEMIVFILFAIFFIMWSFKRCETEKINARHNPRPAQTRSKKVPQEEVQKHSTLYVVVDSLNMRTAPHLDSAVVARLPKDVPVEFYGLRTSFRQQININNAPTNTPWIYIRTESQKEGWIYAGGVNFYKNY